MIINTQDVKSFYCINMKKDVVSTKMSALSLWLIIVLVLHESMAAGRVI